MNSLIYSALLFALLSGAIYFFVTAEEANTPQKIVKVSVDVMSSGDSKSNTIINSKDSKKPFSKKIARQELDRILTITKESARDGELIKLYKLWVDLDPYDAVDYIHQFTKETFKDVLYTIAMDVWSKDNTLAFDNWLQDNDLDFRLTLALEALVLNETTPEEMAIVWVNYIDDLAVSEEARPQIIRRWVAKDPNGAVTWSLRSNTNERLLRDIFEALTQLNPEQTFLTLAILEPAEKHTIINTLNGIRNFLTLDDVTPDVLFAIQLLPSKVRQLTLMMVMPRFSKGDNPAEIGLMIEALPDNYIRTVMLESLAYIWAKEDPEAAAQFAVALPKSERQAQVISAVTAQWHMQDLPAANDWLTSIRGDDTATDTAAHHLAFHAATEPKYVDIATTWVGQISDPKIRETTTKDVVANWIIYDEDKATAFLTEQNIFTPEKLEWFIRDQKENMRLNAQLAREKQDRDAKK